MSRWHDRSREGIAAWGNLSLDERLSDRLADIMVAAGEIHDMIATSRQPPKDVGEIESAVSRIYDDASAVMLRLPEPGRLPARDSELKDVLDEIRRALWEVSALRGPDREIALGWVEQLASPYALAFYFEIERLDLLLGSAATDIQPEMPPS